MEHRTINVKEELSALLAEVRSRQISGEILFSSAETKGKVYLKVGEVAWAFASGQPESFQGILLKEGHLSKDQIIDGINRARLAGNKKLGEILKAMGVVDEELRLSIVARHSKSAMATIGSWGKCNVQLLVKSEAEQAIQAEATEQAAERAVPESTSTDIVSLLNELIAEVPGALLAFVVDRNSGIPVASSSGENAKEQLVEIDTASVYSSELVSAVDRALLGFNSFSVEEGASYAKEIKVIGSDQNFSFHTIAEGQLLVVQYEQLSTVEFDSGSAKVSARISSKDFVLW